MTDGRHAYFDSMYAASADPYGMRDRWYEQRKRAVLLAALPQRHYGSVYEPGCGAGELTAALATRCDAVLASDFSDRAVDAARARTRELVNVRVERHALPQDWPAAPRRFDLLVLSEVGYFLDQAQMAAVATRCSASLADGGTLVACDWLPDFAERVLPTAAVHAALDTLALRRTVQHLEDDFVLSVWVCDGRSVAQREGIRE